MGISDLISKLTGDKRALVQNYSKGGYVTRERERLISAIERVANEDGGNRS
jgi:hypothetical protein